MPVQKWGLAAVQSWHVDEHKPKHLYLVLDPDGEMHFNCDSCDTADDVAFKLKKSRRAAGFDDDGIPIAPLVSATTLAADASTSARKGVHSDDAGPAIIPPPAADDDDGGGGEPAPALIPTSSGNSSNGTAEPAVALYDFQSQGGDELTVGEGDALWILEHDSDEWWKCRNARGDEGVVPASYVEPTGESTLTPAPSANAAHRAAEEKARADADAEKEAEAEAVAAAAAAAAADAEAAAEERRKKEREREQQQAKAQAVTQAAEAERRRKEREAGEAERKHKERVLEREAARDEKSGRSSGKSSSRGSVDKRGPPPADQTRVWHDRSGQFRVEAAFLGYKNGTIRLHKVNGVVIEVPSEKMSIEDMTYVDKITCPRRSQMVANDDDGESLAVRRQSILGDGSSSSNSPSPSRQAQAQAAAQAKRKGPTIDWFEFFLSAGCDIDDYTRCASAFERDKIDEAILSGITESTMRSLGLREGDIIRVRKAIDKRKPRTPAKDRDDDQVRADEALARQLQAQDAAGAKRAPNLFTSSDGTLKNARRGRPQKSSTLPSAVDLNSVTATSISQQPPARADTTSPATVASPVIPPSRSSSALAAPASGFDDDAWTNRPSSTKPLTPTPAVVPARAPSAPPAPAPAPSAASTTVPVPTPLRAASAAPTAQQQQQQRGLSQTTEADIFDQLARLSELRVRAPVAPTPPIASPPAVVSPPVIASPPAPAVVTSPLPAPSPLGVYIAPGPRGPLAPVPVNQALLQPLVPTQTGFRGFVPTNTGVGVGGLQPQPTGFQPSLSVSGLQPQPTGFRPSLAPSGLQSLSSLQAQPTGFQIQPGTNFQPSLAPQPTGFQPQLSSGFQLQPTGIQPQPSSSFLPQPTGFQPSFAAQPTGFNPGFGNSPSPAPPLPTFGGTGFGSSGIQPQPTGFNNFGQNGFLPQGPPPPPQQQQRDTTPANIFAQMKAGTFGDDSAPQSADKYNALRTNTNPLSAQPTGWGFSGVPGGYSGYQG